MAKGRCECVVASCRPGCLGWPGYLCYAMSGCATIIQDPHHYFYFVLFSAQSFVLPSCFFEHRSPTAGEFQILALPKASSSGEMLPCEEVSVEIKVAFLHIAKLTFFLILIRPGKAVKLVSSFRKTIHLSHANQAPFSKFLAGSKQSSQRQEPRPIACTHSNTEQFANTPVFDDLAFEDCRVTLGSTRIHRKFLSEINDVAPNTSHTFPYSIM